MTRRTAIAVSCFIGLLAACGGSDEAADTTVAETTPRTVEPDETTTTTEAPSPTTTQAPATTTTEPAPVGPQTVDELLELQRPVVLAHTGGEGEFPGSTMYSMVKSMEAGVDMLDFNVLLTADGEIVIQHDLTVDRTTDGTGDVLTKTYAELFALDNAYWFTEACTCRDQPDEAYVWRGVRTGDVPPPDGFTADDFAIPTLADVVERFPDALLNIEIKGEGQQAIDLATALAAELRELDRLEASVVTSFDDAAVSAFQALAPEVELTPGLGLSSAWVLERTPLPDGMRILQVPPVFETLVVITPELIADSHAAGYLIWVWPNNRDLENAASYTEFLEQGLDGLNIDFPAAGVEAVLQFIALSD